MSFEEVRIFLQVSRATVYRLAKEGRLTAIRNPALKKQAPRFATEQVEKLARGEG